MKRINFDIAELQAFVAVADRLSFKAAADSLFISQPALSRRIEKLEQALGNRLLERTTRRIALTDLGTQFLSHARAALEELQGAIDNIHAQAAQRAASITVACVPSVANNLLPAVLAAYAADHPATRIKIIDESANDVLTAVVSGVADFGLNFIGTQHPEIDFRAVYKERYVLAVREGHPLAKKASVSWGELMEEKLISVSQSSGNRLLIEHALADVAKRPSVHYEANHVAGALGMVAAGLGVAAVPGLALPSLNQPGIVGIPLIRPAVTRTLGLISRKGTALGSAAQILYDRVAREIRNQ